MRRNYDDPVYKDWRKKVYKRDGIKCQMPKCSSKYRLQAHHTLCREGHDRINGFESHYEAMFNTIVSKNNGKKKST